jgi:vacuolar-type H+-ATPase subunit E/Vma4
MIEQPSVKMTSEELAAIAARVKAKRALRESLEHNLDQLVGFNSLDEMLKHMDQQKG